LPAEIYYKNGHKTSEWWYKDGKEHRDGDLPAAIWYENGNKTIERWYKDGKEHRDGDLPAEIYYKNGQKTNECWYKDGQIYTPAVAKKIEIGPSKLNHTDMNAVYMTEEEFKQAIRDAAKEICGDIHGPVDFNRLINETNIKLAPPQKYRGIEINTKADVYKHIGSIYANATIGWWPRMGEPLKYHDMAVRSHFPQRISHPVLDESVFNTASEMTIRKMGCLAFHIEGHGAPPSWLGVLGIYRAKYDKIMASAPKRLSEEEMLVWTEPCKAAAAAFGPTDDAFIELWRMMIKKRLARQQAGIEASLTSVKDQLAKLSAEIVSALEKISVKPKYGDETNYADLPIMATLE
jgi:hypothetical protein